MKISALFERLNQVFLATSAALVAYTLYLTFMVVPNEKVMGPVQRIFYFHVGAATASYVSIAVLLIASLYYLATRETLPDVIAEAAAEVAFVLCSVVLASGMIWGHSAWNVWFSWEPRLVSFLLLWLVLLSYIALRAFGDKNRVPSHCAVLGILGAVNVPIVIYSIKLLPHIAQLHPQVVENQGLRDPLFVSTMFWGMGALVSLMLLLLTIRARIGLIEREID